MTRKFLAILIILAIFAGTAFAQSTSSLTQTMALKAGFNFVAFNVKPGVTAPNLKLQNQAIIDDIYSYSTASGSFLSVSEGTLMTISAGKGYIVKSKLADNLTIPGEAVATIGDINLKKGFNLIGFSKTVPSLSFSTLMKTAPVIRGLYRYNTTSGSFFQVVKSAAGLPDLLDGVDPSFAMNQAYFIYVDSDTILNYDNNIISIGSGQPAPNLPVVTGINYVSAEARIKWNPVTLTNVGAITYLVLVDGLYPTQVEGTSYPVDTLAAGNHTIKISVVSGGNTAAPGPSTDYNFTVGSATGPFKITAPFANGSVIPAKFLDVNTGVSGALNISPALNWEQPSPNTKSFVIVCEDITTTPATIHWTIYNIPAGFNALPEGIQRGASVTVNGATLCQAKNYNDQFGYDGPNPPQGDPAHNYYFRIYCLSQASLLAGLTYDQVKTEIAKDVTLGNVYTTGTFQNTGSTPAANIPTPQNITYESDSGMIIWTPLVGTTAATYVYRVYLDGATTPEVVNTASYGLPSTIAAGSHTVKVEAMIKDSNPAQVGAKGTLTNNTFNIYDSDKPFKYTTLTTVTNFRYDTATQSLKWDVPSGTASTATFRIIAQYKSNGTNYVNEKFFLDNAVTGTSIPLSTVTAKVTEKNATDVLLEVAASSGMAIGVKSNVIPLPTAAAAPKYFIVNGFTVPSVPSAPGLSGIMRAPIQYDPTKHNMKVYDMATGTVYPPVGNPTSPASYMSQIPIDANPKTIIAEISDKTTGNVLSRNIVGKCPIASEVPTAVKNIELKNVPIDNKSTAMAMLGFEKNALPNVPAFNYSGMAPDVNGLISKALAANELTPYAQTLQNNVGGESVVNSVQMARDAIPQIEAGLTQLDQGIASISSATSMYGAMMPAAYLTLNNSLSSALTTFKGELVQVKSMMTTALNTIPTSNVPNPKAASELIAAYLKATKAQNTLNTFISSYNSQNDTYAMPTYGFTPYDVTIPSGAPDSINLGNITINKDTDPASIPNIISQLSSQMQ